MFLIDPPHDEGPWWLAPGALADLDELDVGHWTLRPGDAWLLTAPRAALDQFSSMLAEPQRWHGLSPAELSLARLGPVRRPRPTWRERLRSWVGLPPVGAVWFDRWSLAAQSEYDRLWALALARSIERDAPVIVLDRVVGQLSPAILRRIGADLSRLVTETGLTLLVLEEFEPEVWPVPSRRVAARLGRLVPEVRSRAQG